MRKFFNKFINVPKKKKKHTYQMRDIVMEKQCSACGIGIGVSKVITKTGTETHHHIQREPKVYRGKDYCDSCYNSLMKRVGRGR